MLAEKTGSSIPASHNSRRRFLKTGSMVSMALGLGELLRLRDVAAATSQRDTSVILVGLPGG